MSNAISGEPPAGGAGPSGDPRSFLALTSSDAPIEVELDVLDRRLIAELQRDGRVSFADLARLTDSAEKTIRRRFVRLLDQRYLLITVVTDPVLMGFDALGLAMIVVGPGDAPLALAEELSRFPEIDYVTVTSGEYGVQAELICVDFAELQHVVARIRQLPAVARVELLHYLQIHYQQAEVTPPLSIPSHPGVRPRPLDALDSRIIAALVDDGRVSFREIARTTDVSEASIRHRYGKLNESGAARVMGIVNPLRMGYRYTSWVGIRICGAAKARDVADALAELPNASYVVLTAGRFDVLAELISPSGQELLTLLDEDVRQIPGIGSIETMVYQDLFYKPLRPRVR